MNKEKKTVCLILLGVVLFSSALTIALSQPVRAYDVWDIMRGNLELFSGDEGPYPRFTEEEHLASIVTLIINVILSFLAVIFVVLIIYGGYMWMTAMGNRERVDKARDIIINSIIGLAIILAAYAISYFVLRQLANAIS